MKTLRIFAAAMASFVACITTGVHAAAQSAGVVLIDYDTTTAAQHGEFPSRTQLAQLTERLHAAGARSVLLKFFFDGPGDAAGNAALANALGKGRSLLQASLSTEPPTSKALDARFLINTPLAGIQPAIRGNEGWMPLPMFAQAAASICFADVQQPERVPLFESFAGKPVPTLYHCLLAEIAGVAPELKPGVARFGTRQWSINPAGEITLDFKTRNRLPRIPAAWLFGGVQDWQARVKGKVAVLMYTGPRSPMRDIQGKSMKVHEVFALQAVNLLESGSAIK